MKLEDYYRIYAAAHGRREFTQARAQLAPACQAVSQASAAEIQWFEAALADTNDEMRKQFVAYLLHEAAYFPEPLLSPMLKAAIEELNPNIARSFVEPCVRCFTARKVLEELLVFLRAEDDFGKTGTVISIHWALIEASREGALQEAALGDVRQRLRKELLELFIGNANLDLRRAIVTNLDTRENAYPEALTASLAKAIKLARGHSDQYIRNRIEVQLGNQPAQYTLPARQPRSLTGPASKKSWWSELWK